MTIEPNSRGKPPPDIIEKYWKGVDAPSQRSIAAKMRADGWRVSPSTVIRCVKGGFGPNRAKDTKPSKPIQTGPAIDAANRVAAAADGSADPQLIGEAMIEAFRNLPPGEKDRIKQLVEMDDQELENNTGKMVKVARFLMAEAMATNARMMLLMPDKAAKLYVALGTNLLPVVMPPAPNASDNAKVIDNNPNEPRRLSPSAQAIADFRARRGSVAA